MFLTRDEIDYVKAVLDGRYDDDLMLADFRAFMKAEFGVRLYCFFCDKAGESLYKNRLRFIVDDDSKSVFHKPPWSNRDPYKEGKIKAKFSELCVRHNCYADFRNPEEYFAIANEFETDFRCDIVDACHGIIEDYLKSVEEVKLVSNFGGNYYFFYERDEDIKTYEDSGLSEEIAERVFEIIKAHDTYNVYKERRVFFDSVQTLNEKYQGSLFYYHR